MNHIAILAERGIQDEEFIYPYYRLLEERYTVDVATLGGTNVTSKNGAIVKATMAIETMDADRYDCVLIPGGFESPSRLRTIPEVRRFVRKIHDQDKLVAAICHGSWVCISAGIVKGKKMTSYDLEIDLTNAGAIFVDAPVVVDGNLITAPHYRNNGDFMREVVGWLNQREMLK